MDKQQKDDEAAGTQQQQEMITISRPERARKGTFAVAKGCVLGSGARQKLWLVEKTQ